MNTSKDNLQAFLGPITFEDNLQDRLRLSNLRASSRFILGQPVSPAMLELPLSRDFDLHYKLELHCSSLHHNLDIVILDLDMIRLVIEHWIL